MGGMDDPNMVEMELTLPTAVGYSTVRLRACRRVRGPPNTVPVDDFDSWLSRERLRTWDALADELTEMAMRQANRVSDVVQARQQAAQGGK